MSHGSDEHRSEERRSGDHGNHRPVERRPERRPESSVSKNEVQPRVSKVGDLQCFNLYVGNLPLNWSRRKVREKFRVMGGVLQVFIPDRLNKAGKRFGFVRMDLESDITTIINSLHNSFFDKNKIIVRQADSYTYSSKLPIPNPNYHNLRFVPTSVFQQSDSRSYRDVTNGAKRPVIPSISMKPIADNDEWLERSLVGWLKKPCSPSAVVEKLKSLMDIEVEISYMGGNMLLISCKNLGDLDYVFSNRQALLPLFVEVRMWKQEYVSNQRMAWIRCSGIPLNIWGIELFKKIGTIWGDFVSLDKATMEKSSLDSGRVLIRTGNSEKIKGFVNVEVGSKAFKVGVQEEFFDGFNFDCKCKLAVEHELMNVCQKMNCGVNDSFENLDAQNTFGNSTRQLSTLKASTGGIPAVKQRQPGKLSGNTPSAVKMLVTQALNSSQATSPVLVINASSGSAPGRDVGKLNEQPNFPAEKLQLGCVKMSRNEMAVTQALNFSQAASPVLVVNEAMNPNSIQVAACEAASPADSLPLSVRQVNEDIGLSFLSTPVTCNTRPRRTKNLCVILKKMSKRKTRGKKKISNSPLNTDGSSCKCQVDKLSTDVVEDSLSTCDIENRNRVIKDSASSLGTSCSEVEETCRVGMSLGVFDPSNANLLSLAIQDNIDKELSKS